ncbi:hypothetical protein GUJ93_ZPchr0003g17854 [Zizania palustris]|uniref:Uncharacterized protein n=1 Tax=Zizania palustris TaxID=103762 RepID=A0A8J5VWZ9_ZIZPA|nr:hypothetical protein GUJ93_ZPchr0003g17854 [Zizania palustris]
MPFCAEIEKIEFIAQAPATVATGANCRKCHRSRPSHYLLPSNRAPLSLASSLLGHNSRSNHKKTPGSCAFTVLVVFLVCYSPLPSLL